MNTHQWLTGLLDVAGSQPRGANLRQCPAHRDSAPSLSVRPAPDGWVAVKCFRGCTTDEILSALHCSRLRLARPAPMPPADYAQATGLRLTFPPAELRHGHPATRGYRLEAVHDYGRAVLERWRTRSGDKELIWETVMDSGRRIPGLIGVTLQDLPLYRERELGQAIALDEPVLLVESESSVDALRGFYSTTWAGGASAVNIGRLTAVLGGYRRVCVIPDNDPAGLRVLERLDAAGLAPAHLMPAEGQDARDLYRQVGHQRITELVYTATRNHTSIRRAA